MKGHVRIERMFGFFTDKKRWGTLLREGTVQLSFLAHVKEEYSD